MGFRSLLEINHDNISEIERDPQKFVAAVSAYVSASARFQADKLYQDYNVKVIGLRHSSDNYCIPANQWGFPATLPWDDFESERESALAEAKNLTGGDRRSKRSLEDMIQRLVAIIERQQDALDGDD